MLLSAAPSGRRAPTPAADADARPRRTTRPRIRKTSGRACRGRRRSTPRRSSRRPSSRRRRRPARPTVPASRICSTASAAVLLDGAPFPERQPYDPKFPEARSGCASPRPRRPAPGDGSLEHPWKDLQQALCALEPGDRLVVASGIYTGSFRVAGTCRSGTAEAPIQVFARHAFLKSGGSGDVLTIERAHWQLWEVQIALLDSEVRWPRLDGPGAHDIAIDQTTSTRATGRPCVLAAGGAKIILSNCHIHQSMGVRIEGGASAITLLNNHIHHNRAASVTVGGGSAARRRRADVSLLGNRIHNDHGPALDLSHCDGRDHDSRNRLSNYRPDEDDGTGGERDRRRAPGCKALRFENNTVLEASVGGADRGGGLPGGGAGGRAILAELPGEPPHADATAVSRSTPGRGSGSPTT